MMMKKLTKFLKDFFETPLGKGIITTLRNAALAAAGIIVSELITLFTGSDLEPTTKLIIIGALKLLDEGLHKTGIAEKGLTRF